MDVGVNFEQVQTRKIIVWEKTITNASSAGNLLEKWITAKSHYQEYLHNNVHLEWDHNTTDVQVHKVDEYKMICTS